MSNSKMPRTDAEPSTWTVSDFDQCVQLVLVARSRGGFDDVMDRVKRIENGLHTEFNAVGLADGDYRLCDEFISGKGAMTDGSKRRFDNDTPVSGDVECSAGYVMPNVSDVPFSSHASTVEVPLKMCLPPGITSVPDWGTYKVSFGKFQGKKTYAEIRHESTAEMASYRGYVMSHRKSGSAQLKDLAAYLIAAGYEGEESQIPKIPGTTIARQR